RLEVDRGVPISALDDARAHPRHEVHLVPVFKEGGRPLARSPAVAGGLLRFARFTAPARGSREAPGILLGVHLSSPTYHGPVHRLRYGYCPRPPIRPI